MVERIRTLLETRQLTPTQFADAIGVARPIVSHILSGRNKPSLEVVQRILAAMPDLSMPWLLNGTGPMQASAASTVPAGPVAAVPPGPAPPATKESPVPLTATQPRPTAGNEMQTVPAGPSKAPAAGPLRPMPRRFTSSASKAVSGLKDSAVLDAPTSAAPLAAGVAGAAPAPSLATVAETVAEPEAASPTTAFVQEQAVSPEALPVANTTAAALFAGAEKPIRRIVIFYRDGSFADYQPE